MMARVHLITGLLTLGTFFLSGLYMVQSLNLPEQSMDAQRMMYRASHIYLLFIGCLNIIVGVYVDKEEVLERRNLKILSSVSLIAVQPVLIAAFVVEPEVIDKDRILTLVGCVFMVVGVFFAVLAKILSRYGNNLARSDAR